MESKEDTGIEAIDTELDTLESIPAKIIEGGQRMIQSGFKISIRDVCEFNKVNNPWLLGQKNRQILIVDVNWSRFIPSTK